jgi:hypothetical protein
MYNYLAFGSMWHIGYEYSISMKQGFFGISIPSATVIFELIFGQKRGLLWVSPVLALAPIAYVYAFRYLLRDVALVLLVVPMIYLLINGGYHYWDGGASTGPRHMTPSLGFISLAFGPLWGLASLRMRVILLAAGLISGVISLICASVDMTTPRLIARPLPDWIFPSFLRRVHNVLVSPGLHDLRSLVTVVAIPSLWVSAAIVAALLPRWRKRRRPAAATSP